ncbi:hypothetical protein IFM89_032218 [Coptis chinensis]|uniref:Myb/SANT-like domain-containing protein n=1 Tax=Coptis chinensis TaxID=261450 RepID=A0A835LW21_9MAGN|nr:hypothetical protein IFM89_032218 [Coptis chinensis]
MENNQSPEQPKSTKAKGNYVVWTIEMDRVLTETFLDQVQKGNKSEQGFGWDDNRKMIVVRDDVWENYVKSHPDAKGFRYKPLTNYDELAIIVGKNNAKGVGR